MVELPYLLNRWHERDNSPAELAASNRSRSGCRELPDPIGTLRRLRLLVAPLLLAAL